MPRAPSLALRWWAQQWIEPVESLGPEFGGRLSRARSYARNRRIWQLGVRPGMLSAQALGSFGYYAVTVQVPSNPDGVWERVQTTLSDRPALLASLLADDLPADVEQAEGVVDHLAVAGVVLARVLPRTRSASRW